jgi:RNA polymerase sigma-70 factor, ECF subfamily
MNEYETDRQLVRRLLDGQSEGWREFVETYQELVYSRVKFSLRLYSTRYDQTDVEDLTAEVFAKLLENDCRALKNFAGRCRLATWLTVIARRRTIKWLRRKESSRNLADVKESELVDGGVDVQETVSREETSEMFRHLAALEERDQQLLRLFYLEEKSYQEISEILGMAINSIGPSLHRARSRLKSRMRAS